MGAITQVVTTITGVSSGETPDSFVRGNVIRFAVNFTDAAGDAVVPESAAVKISTAPLGVVAEAYSLDLVESSGTWTVDWDTTAVAPAIVFWSIKSVNPAAADQGRFDLVANLANEAA